MRFHNKLRDYVQVSSFGLFAGILVLLAGLLPNDSLWSVPSITVLYGFWIVCASVLIWRSTSHLAAGLHVFLFFFFLTVAFYGVRYVLGLFLPQFDHGVFPIRQFLYYAAVSLVCGIAAFILYCWHHNNWYAAILLAMPIGILAAETLSVLQLLHNNHTHLFQVLFDAGFCLYIGLQFRKMTRYKELYTVSVIAVAWLANRFIY